MSEYIDPLSRAAILRWLRSLGVLCDCDNGVRSDGSSAGEHNHLVPCSRCTLVEVDGTRVRWLRNRSGFEGGNELVWMPAVEVTE